MYNWNIILHCAGKQLSSVLDWLLLVNLVLTISQHAPWECSLFEVGGLVCFYLRV